MIPPAFDYHRPESLPEAIELLTRYGEGAKILSGGQSLLPLLKIRLAAPEHLIDIGKIAGLTYLREEDGFLRIGACTSESALEKSELVQRRYLLLHDTTRVIADPLVRNRATVGGNLAHGDPANDHPATMIALRADIVVIGPAGERVIPAGQFFRGLYTTALAADEILIEVRVPVPPPRSGGAYVKLERKVGDYATAATAAQVALDESGAIARAGLGLTNAGTVPVQPTAAESYLAGKQPTDDVVAEAARLAGEAAQPSPDRRGSVEYKRAMARIHTGRALSLAIQRARGR